MGYSTEFTGSFTITPALTENQREYLKAWVSRRRMKRNGKACAKMHDPWREAVKLPVGTEGEYFAGGTGYAGQEQDSSIIDYNNPPRTQPGLWCQWRPNDEGTELEWDGGEKFYSYVEWLRYMIDNFFTRWNSTLSGTVHWQGEDSHDSGRITIKNNEVIVCATGGGLEGGATEELKDFTLFTKREPTYSWTSGATLAVGPSQRKSAPNSKISSESSSMTRHKPPVSFSQ